MLTRKQCCTYFDGRPNQWHGYACIPSQNNSQFLSGNVCEPTLYADQHPEHRGTCPDDPPSTPLPDDVIDGASVPLAAPEPAISDGGAVAGGASPAPAPIQDPQPQQNRVGHHHGCYMLTRKQCCTYFDGRPNQWHGYACIPSQNGSQFLSGNVCEPSLYADQHPEHRGTCPDDSSLAPPVDNTGLPTPAPARAAQPQNPWRKLEESRIAVSHGCDTLAQNECCAYFDGRGDEWHGQICIPSRLGSKFASGNVCEPSGYAEQHPDHRGVCRADEPPRAGAGAPAEAPARPQQASQQKAPAEDDLDEEARDKGIVIDGKIPADQAPPSTPSPLAADMGESAPMSEVRQHERGDELVPQPLPARLARSIHEARKISSHHDRRD